MSETATATIDEPIVAPRDGAALFGSRRSDLRLVKVPRFPQFGASGQKVGETVGEVIVFREGLLRCPRTGTVMLEDGREADAAEVLEWLESHKLLGNREEGFFRVETAAPAVTKDEMQALMRAAVRLDVETLQAALEQERAGWDREDVIATIEESLAEITPLREEALAAQEKAEAEAAGA
jgi:hypothetical protein